MPRRKKTEQKTSNESSDKKIVEPPKNLLMEESGTKDVKADKKDNFIEDGQVTRDVQEEIKKEDSPVVVASSGDQVVETPSESQDKAKVEEVKKEEKEVEVKSDVKDVELTQDIVQSVVESKPVDVKSEDIVAASEVSPPPLPMTPSTASAPVSIPVTKMDVSAGSNQSGKGVLMKVGLGVLLAFITAGGFWIYSSRNSKKTESQIITNEIPLTTPAVNISPTQVAASGEVKADKYEVKVLNGSGIAGEASKVKDILEKEGYKVSETGNADNYDYTDSVIQTKKGVDKTFTDKLKSLLEKSYSVGKDELASSSDSSEVIIIVGSEKAGN